ncbi:MAG: hypothetical protein ABI619_01155 [Betaproteobacteria bacterium]
MQPVLSWRKSLGLEQYAQVFDDNDVGFNFLCILQDKALQDLCFGHRKKPLDAIAASKEIKEHYSSADPRSDNGGERRQLTVLFWDMSIFG